jgi:nitroreductase
MDPQFAEQVLRLLQNHRSIRKFTEQKIPEETINQIILSAQMASTSSHVQAYTIIGVTDPELRRKLAEYSGKQSYVESCAHFLVFCADLNRLDYVTRRQGVDVTETLDTTEKFIVATVDAALAAQNAAIAAEANGLGIVYIGGIRNNSEQVATLLELPAKVYPVFGMCLGYPAQDPDLKPRLPMSCVYFENHYPDLETIADDLEQYDQRVRNYYIQRTKGKRQETWSEMMVKTLAIPIRTHMKSFLEKWGFPFK